MDGSRLSENCFKFLCELVFLLDRLDHVADRGSNHVQCDVIIRCTVMLEYSPYCRLIRVSNKKILFEVLEVEANDFQTIGFDQRGEVTVQKMNEMAAFWHKLDDERIH